MLTADIGSSNSRGSGLNARFLKDNSIISWSENESKMKLYEHPTKNLIPKAIEALPSSSLCMTPYMRNYFHLTKLTAQEREQLKCQ